MKKTKEILFEMMQEAVELGFYQEDPKQETLEEAAHEYFKRGQLGFEKAADTETAFLKGAKWQQERMLELMDEYVDDVMGGCNLTAKEWFEQFNKEK